MEISPAAESEQERRGGPRQPRPSWRGRRLGRFGPVLSLERLPALVLVVAVLVFLAIRLGPSLLGDRVFLGLDTLRLYEPWNFSDNHPVTSFWYVTDHLDFFIPSLHEVHQRLLSGDFPSWSSLPLGGAPLLSQPTLGVFTPGRVLYLVLPTWLAPAWSKLVELILSWGGTYLFARRLNASKLAASLAGVVYPLTGFMIGWTNYPQVAVGALIPVLFWSVERYLEQPTIRAALPVALTSALLMFGGFPAVAGQTFYVVGGFAVVRLIACYRTSLRALALRAVTLVAAVAVGIALSAFQLLPFADGVLGGVDLGYRSTDFFNKTKFLAALTALFPKTFSTNSLCCSYSPQDVNTYVGALVMFLGLVGVLQVVTGRLAGSVGVYFSLTIVLVIVLIWFQGPWTNWMDHLPILHGNPIGRTRSQLGMPVAVLAAAGVDYLRGHRWSPGWLPSRLRESPRVAAVIALAMVVFVGALAWELHTHGVPAARLEPDTIIAAVPVAIVAVLLPIRRARNWLLAVAMAGVIVQGLAATSFYWPTADRNEFYPTDAAIAYLQQHQGHDRIATTGLTFRPNATQFYGLRTLDGHGFLDPDLKRVTLGIDPTALLGPTETGFTTAVDRILRSPGLDRMGVRYLVAGVDDVLPGTTNQPVPIPGVADPLPAEAGALPLAAGTQYVTTVPDGPLRGVQIPVTVTAPARVTVSVTDSAGRLVAQDTRRAVVGARSLPVPLADDPGGARPVDASRSLIVRVSVDRSGVEASAGRGDHIRLQAVRPPAAGDSIRLAFAGAGLVIWQRLHVVPRIHWAGEATVIPAAAARVRAVATAPVAPGQVILSSPPAEPLPARASSARVQVTADSGDDVTARVDASGAGFLVVSDTIQQGFAASVDGRATPIVAADEAGGAVYVPAGRHVVRLSYAPAGRTAGAAISVVSLVVLLGAAVPPAWAGAVRRRVRREAGR